MTPRLRALCNLLLIYVALGAAHFSLLRLPYFWDEAGYYIPAAWDFFQTGSLIPTSTLTNAHPPLPSIYLAIWWKIFGFSPLVTRLAMLAVATFALWQVYLLAKRIANQQVAWATTLLTAAFPVFFAQSSLAHADLPAMALTLLGLRLYIEDKRLQCAAAFACAALAKETAILTPVVLLVLEGVSALLSRSGYDLHFHENGMSASILPQTARRAKGFLFSFAFVPLAIWYAYHFLKTGFIFGNPEFVKYNVATTLSPMRFVLALAQRTWQAFGHMNMWVLTAATGAALLLPALFVPGQSAQPGTAMPHESQRRPRIAIGTQLLFGLLIAAHLVAYSMIGGALLSRYLMPVFPLVIVIAVSTLWRRVREWKWVTGFVLVTFVAGWFVNPPYHFAPEDNLNYADYVRLHQDAIRFLEGKSGIESVLTAWTTSDELRDPYLGYVAKPPVRVVRIENFSFEQIMLAQQSTVAYDAVLAFSTKYEPTGQLVHWNWWEQQNVRFFQYHRDMPPEVIARMLGGAIVMQESRNGQWVAVIEMPRTRNARLEVR